VRHVEQRALRAFQAHFGGDPELITSAPGRINLIGEHTDYNGGFVLPCAIDRRVAVALGHGLDEAYSADYEQLASMRGVRTDTWIDYPRGVIWAFEQHGHAVPPLHAAIAGDVPQGAGLSSSAAIEAAMALAVAHLLGLSTARADLALLCQQAENAFVGVQSGIMDQFASLLCSANTALLLDCRSLDVTPVPLDLAEAGLALLVCDTGVRRTLGATGYNQRRQECEQAAHALGVGQLRDATVAQVSTLGGRLGKRARHVVTENARVLAAADALRTGAFAALGALMSASHASLRDDFEVSTPELDAFVEVAIAQGALGARLTGAGFGGSAIALVAINAQMALAEAVRAAFAGRGYSAPAFYDVQVANGAEVVA
jgi:galactokinase